MFCTVVGTAGSTFVQVVEVVTPAATGTDTVTVNAPGVAFAVKVGAVAMPVPSVVAVTVVSPPVKVPWPAGTLNCTTIPDITLPPPSRTVARNAPTP